jgi:ABC-type transporter MlaC component
MNYRWSCNQQRGVAMVVSLALLMVVTACASDQTKPIPQSTPDQVRGHADRTFEKLKQEEQERAAQPPTPR